MKYLAYDVEHIKRYIFSSRLLKTVVGGSLAVREFDDRVGNLLKQLGFEVIYADGGTGLAKAPENINKQQVFQEILNLAERYGLNVNMILEDLDSVKIDQPDFFDSAQNLEEVGKLFARAGFLINKEKQKLRPSHIKSMDERKICKVCGEHEATTQIPTADNLIDACEICYTKNKLALKEASENTYDISQIANAATEKDEGMGYIAIIYADGNSLGTLFEKCKTFQEYKELSRLISNTVEVNTKQVVERYTQNFARPILGGDDILLFIPPEKALHILQDLHKELLRAFKDKKIDFSFALIVLPADLPFLLSYEMANQLLKISKSERNLSGSGYFIAFEYVDKIEQNRSVDSEKEAQRSAMTIEEFYEIIEFVKKLKKAGFTKNHLQKFKTILEKSESELEKKINCSYFFIRAIESAETEKLLNQFLNVTRKYSYQVFSDLFTYVSDFGLG